MPNSEQFEDFEEESKVQEKSPDQISLIKEKYNINYTEEEKELFDNWKKNIPENSPQNPIKISGIGEILAYLPQCGNYKEEQLNLYFSKEQFSEQELHKILENFSRNNPDFEISVEKLADNLISIAVGNKTGGSKVLGRGEDFGHYHPTSFEFENRDLLPEPFNKGLLPSGGGIHGWYKNFENIRNGTRIFSKYGYILIKPTEKFKNIPEETLKHYIRDYLDLFLGENKFNFKISEEAIKYFKDDFGLDIEFHYYKES